MKNIENTSRMDRLSFQAFRQGADACAGSRLPGHGTPVEGIPCRTSDARGPFAEKPCRKYGQSAADERRWTRRGGWRAAREEAGPSQGTVGTCGPRSVGDRSTGCSTAGIFSCYRNSNIFLLFEMWRIPGVSGGDGRERPALRDRNIYGTVWNEEERTAPFPAFLSPGHASGCDGTGRTSRGRAWASGGGRRRGEPFFRDAAMPDKGGGPGCSLFRNQERASAGCHS